MNDLREQILENQRALLKNLTDIQKTFFDGYARLVDLNMQVLKSGFDETAQQAADLEGAQGFIAFTSGLARPDVEKVQAYGEQMREIMNQLQAELTALCESHMTRCQEQIAQTARQTPKRPAPRR